MMKFLEKLNTVIGVAAALMTLIMMILCLIGIGTRYVKTWTWPDAQELAVYAMVYVVMLGSTCAVYNKTHIAVTILADMMPPGGRFVVRLISYAAMIIFFVLMIDYGWALTQRSMLQLSPITGIPVGYIVVSIPFSAAVSILYVIKHIVEECREYRQLKSK